MRLRIRRHITHFHWINILIDNFIFVNIDIMQLSSRVTQIFEQYYAVLRWIKITKLQGCDRASGLFIMYAKTVLKISGLSLNVN